MPRRFNVFSPEVVVFENETFEWEVTSQEDPSGSAMQVSPASGQPWPLNSPSYSVVPGTPSVATVTGACGTESIFQCTPGAPNVSSQKIIVGCGPFDVCGEVSVGPGQHFVWRNQSDAPVTISPSPANSNYWPLKHPHHTVPAHGHLAVHMPGEARSGQSYTLVATGCSQLGQPKIIVQ